MNREALAAIRVAIIHLDSVSRGFLLAQDTYLPAEERFEYARKAWSSWSYACAAMAELQEHMPNSAEAGYARNAEIAEWRERNPKEAA